MKKTYVIFIILAVVVLVAGAAAFVLAGQSVQQAQSAHEAVYETYQDLLRSAEETSLTILEDGVILGSYSLEELGLLPGAKAAVERAFSDQDRLAPKQFAALSAKAQIRWNALPHPMPQIAVPLEGLELYTPIADLISQPRQEAQNAHVKLSDGMYVVYPEVPGTQLKVDALEAAMTSALEGLTLSDVPTSVRFELMEHDVYIPPEKTVENTTFDFQSMLAQDLQNRTVTIAFQNAVETLQPEALTSLLTVDSKGRITVEEKALREVIAQWAQKHQATNVPYLLDAYIGGTKPIDFLKVDYAVEEEQLLLLLQEKLPTMEDLELEAPLLCTRKGEPFSLGAEYVEIDIPNQTMTYFQDGEVYVTTDVVTGASWGYPTPPGLYKVENKDTNCWLSGEDYRVHVDYWIGFIGFTIGIHDADWRTKFGGENYIRNGSHGCVNTPKEATAKIFDSIEIGVPVLVYGK